jgi:hypothetical protein
MCEKAFASNNFLLLYFTNRKQFTPQFNEPSFKEAIRNKFQFLQLSRADKAGNWLATSFHVKCSPYFAIIDPSDGQFLAVAYRDLTIPEIRDWLQRFLLPVPQFGLPQTIFTELIEGTHKIKLKASFAYGAKIRVSFTNPAGEERIVYVNRIAPLEIAFDKYCSEKGIDAAAHYFLFKGLDLPGTMSASQFGLRNGSVIHVHPLEDKTSTEPLSITVINVDGTSGVFNVTRGKKLGAFLKSYCDISSVNPQQMRFTFNNDVVFEDLTFAEHGMKNGDQLYAHLKPYQTQPEFMYRMMNQEVLVPSMQQETYEVAVPNQNMMFMYGQGQAPRQMGLPGSFQPNPFVTPFQMPGPPATGKSVHYQNKPHDQNPGSSIWEGFDMP